MSCRNLLTAWLCTILLLTSVPLAADGDEGSRVFDEKGNLVERGDKLGNRTLYLRDNPGRVVEVVHVLNKAGRWIDRTFRDRADQIVVEVTNAERRSVADFVAKLRAIGFRPGRDQQPATVRWFGHTAITSNGFGSVEEFQVPNWYAAEAGAVVKRTRTRVAGLEATVEEVRVKEGLLVRDDLGYWRMERYDSEGLISMEDEVGAILDIERDKLGRPSKAFLGETAVMTIEYGDGTPDWTAKEITDLRTGAVIYRWESVVRPGELTAREELIAYQPQASIRATLPGYGVIAEWDETVHPQGVVLAGSNGTPFTLLPLAADLPVMHSATPFGYSITPGSDRIDYSNDRMILRLETDERAMDGSARRVYVSIPRKSVSRTSSASSAATGRQSENTSLAAERWSLTGPAPSRATASLRNQEMCGGDNPGCVCWDDGGANSGVICPSGDGGGGGGDGGGEEDPSPSGGGGGQGMPLSPQRAMMVNMAKSTAKTQLQAKQTCRDLFKDLTLKDGVQVIDSTTYRAHDNHQRCQEGAAMFTSVGSLIVYVCQAFESQSSDLRAALVIHEAMHSAGQKESPQYPGYPTSSQLTTMVRQACGL